MLARPTLAPPTVPKGSGNPSGAAEAISTVSRVAVCALLSSSILTRRCPPPSAAAALQSLSWA